MKQNRLSPFAGKLAVLFLLTFIGVIGYMVIEQYNFLDAIYMTVVTLTTIGYHEVQPLSPSGKVFNTIFIMCSFAVFAYIISSLTRYISSGEMTEYNKNRRLMNAIENFSGHVIICGFGRHGQEAAKILQTNNVDFVVIDTDETHINSWLEDHNDLVYIHGDGTEDEILIKAGINKAQSLVLTFPVDADNVFTVLSARSINPDLVIISRAQQKASEAKLRKAGANHVILPEMIGGIYMAGLVSKPDVIEFINNLWGDEDESISIESISYEKLPDVVKDKSISEIISWFNSGVNCLGIKDAYGKFVMNPSTETIIEPGMKIMLFGSMHQVNELNKKFAQ